MKARLPKGYGNGGINNIQQLAAKAQKMQEEMGRVSKELEEKETKEMYDRNRFHV